MPELLDICDHEGHLTGETMVRSEVHKNQEWHRVALVWIINGKGEILLQRRAEHLTLFPGLWDVTVSGHVSAGDEPTPTVVREVGEELGLAIVPEQVKFIDVVADRLPTTVPERMHQEYDFLYVVRQDVKPDEYEAELRDPAKSTRHSQRNDDVYWAVLNEARKVTGAES